MPTSDEEVQQKAEEVQKLREQVQNAEANRVQRERDLANEVTLKQLETEEALLRARLIVAKEQGKVAAVNEGASYPLNAATDQMKAAVAAQKAAEKDAENAARSTESTGHGSASADTAATTTEDGGNK